MMESMMYMMLNGADGEIKVQMMISMVWMIESMV